MTAAGVISAVLGIIPSLICCIAPSVTFLGLLVGASIFLSFFNWAFLILSFLFFVIAAFLYHRHPKTCR
jgi:hypothetical protein